MRMQRYTLRAERFLVPGEPARTPRRRSTPRVFRRRRRRPSASRVARGRNSLAEQVEWCWSTQPRGERLRQTSSRQSSTRTRYARVSWRILFNEDATGRPNKKRGSLSHPNADSELSCEEHHPIVVARGPSPGGSASQCHLFFALHFARA